MRSMSKLDATLGMSQTFRTQSHPMHPIYPSQQMCFQLGKTPSCVVSKGYAVLLRALPGDTKPNQ